MFELTKEQQEKLEAMSFLEYAKFVKERIKYISYSKGSSTGYWEGIEWATNLISRYKKEYNLTDDNYHNRYLGDMFRNNLLDLRNYGKYHKSDTGKRNTISQFKRDMDDHLTELIYELENPEK